MPPTPPSEAPLAGAFAFPPGVPFFWDATPWSGAARMAADAAAFAAAEAGADEIAPRLAWWTWDRPTISLGRLQDAAHSVDATAAQAAGVPVVRRPTGGRAILHGDEWTYSALVPLDHPVLGGGLAASTRAVVALVAAALGEAYGLAFDAPSGGGRVERGARAAAAACFAGGFGYELSCGGRKLMGSAQRRGRRVLLQQGSLLLGGDPAALAAFLPGPAAARASAARALAHGATTLTAVLGAPPDPTAFRAALARGWEARTRPSTQGRGEGPAAP